MGELSRQDGFEEPTKDSGDDLNLIYKVEGNPNELDVFELAGVLEGFGKILKEGFRVAYPGEGELSVKVKPFQEGSFIVDLALQAKHVAEAGMLFVTAHPELIEHTKNTLKGLGFIIGTGNSVLDIIRKLKGEKPASIKKKSEDHYEVHGRDGSVIPINSKVKNLYNNQTVKNYYMNVVIPASHESVSRLLMHLKDDPESAQKITKDDVQAIGRYTKPPEPQIADQTLEIDVPRVLHPKSGDYGDTSGTWQFTVAGSTTKIKAKISDKDFLSEFSSGEIRFHKKDILRVLLKERQTIRQGKPPKMEYEILEVLEYVPSVPLEKTG